MIPGIILCTRLESRRIPHKPLQKVSGTPIIRLLVERLKRGNYPVCVAMPKSESNEIYNALNESGADHYFGSDDNVLQRFYLAAKQHNYDPVIRVTHDDILIDTQLMKKMVDRHKVQGADYTFVRDCIDGTGAEIVSMSLLSKAAEKYTEDKSIEHLSYAFKEFSTKTVEYQTGWSGSNPRLTIDYPKDLEVMRTVFNVIGYSNFDISTLKIHLESTLQNISEYNKLPAISIYTCVYNAENTIDRAIQSVLSQGMQDYEYIVCDDASTDKTRERLWKYIENPKIKFIVNDKNIGLAASCNKVLNKAKGKYYMRLDADDEFKNSQSVDKLYQEINKDCHNAICYSSYTEQPANKLKFNENHHMGCAIVQAKAFHELKFNGNLRHWEGHDFYLKAKDRFKIAYLHESIWIYHRSEDSMSNFDTHERKKIKKAIDGQYEGDKTMGMSNEFL